MTELKMFFHMNKQRIEKPKLYNKVKLVEQMRAQGESSFNVLSEDCFDHVITYLLDKNTIKGPKPKEPRYITTVTIKRENEPVTVGKKEWQQFKQYVAKHANWTAYGSFIYPNTTYHIMYVDRHE